MGQDSALRKNLPPTGIFDSDTPFPAPACNLLNSAQSTLKTKKTSAPAGQVFFKKRPDMDYKSKYSIGEMSSICKISKKALRYYDEINLISSLRNDFNNYRFYTVDSLLTVPVIKFYKQMGFTLDEMRGFIEGEENNIYKSLQRSFQSKIEEIDQQQLELRQKHESVRDWHQLITEAEMVIDNCVNETSIKYVEPLDLLYLDQEYENNLEASIINIDFTNYVEEVNNKITGPVIINFSSVDKRINNEPQRIKILQKTIEPCQEGTTYTIGGHIAASCYHIGSHDNISETYEKMSRWAKMHGYVLAPESYERYVTDYWTTKKNSKFVTEIIIPAKCEAHFVDAEQSSAS